MSSFLLALNAVLPFVFYMAFGGLVRKTGIADIPFLRKLNLLVFKAFFPLMMFDNIYNMAEGQGMRPSFLLFCVMGQCLLLAVSVAVIHRVIPDRNRIAVLSQAIYRSNILLFAVPLARSIYGESAVGIATALVVFIVPLYNVSGAVLFEAYSDKGHTSLKSLLTGVVTNPLIAGLVAALPFRLLHIGIPQVIMSFIHQFSVASTPLALFILGGTLQFDSLVRNRRPLTVIFFLKLLLVPGVMLFLATLFGFTPMERFIAFTLYATPMATSVYSMAQHVDADVDLAGEIIVVTSVGSVFTMFFWVFFLQAVGFLQ